MRSSVKFPRSRIKEGFFAPAPTAVFQRRLKVATALLGRSVEVGGVGNANRLRRLRKLLAKGMAIRVDLDAQRPIRCVAVVRKSCVTLGAPDVGQDIVVSPSGIAHRLPAVVVATVASDIRHQVQYAGAADGATSRIGDPPPKQLLLRRAGGGPVELGSPLIHRCAWNGRQVRVRLTASLDQKHLAS